MRRQGRCVPPPTPFVSGTSSNDKPPLMLPPPPPPQTPSVKRVTVTSKVPLLGREPNLSKCFSCSAQRPGFSIDYAHKDASHTHTHTRGVLLSSNFSPAGEKIQTLKVHRMPQIEMYPKTVCLPHRGWSPPPYVSVSVW